MIALRCFPAVLRGIESVKISQKPSSVVVCGAKGPRPRFPRVWKTNKRIGTISKSQKLLQCIKGLSNVKEEVYGALDSFIAWELEFPLITVKKAIRSLEEQSQWKRIIQVSKWMLSKGQGRTMGTYTILLSALAEDGRLEEAEELWTKLFTQYLESTPRNLFNKMMSIYYHREMHDKMFELFADMEELGVQPNIAIVSMMGIVFKKLGMLDKYEKLKRKYPPTKWVVKYIRGKRVRIRAKGVNEIEFKNNEPNSDQTEKLENDVDEIEEFKNKEPNSDQIEKLENELNELEEEEEITGNNEIHD